MLSVQAICWVDGGRSCGQDTTEYCLALLDDAGAVFSASVQELTAATLTRFITLKDKCKGPGLTKVVGPFLRSVMDLALYGAVHQATGTRVRVEIKELVADMDALICLGGKQLQTPCHCPWCTEWLRKGNDRIEEGPWGELTPGHNWADADVPYGYWMYRWLRDVLPKRQGDVPYTHWKAKDGSTNWRRDTAGLGKERPVLFRYKKVITTERSKWAAGTADVPLREGSMYRTPHAHEEGESTDWDVVTGTLEEHMWLEHWLGFVLRLLPDELHITQRLIEGWRDAAVARAKWNGSLMEGKLVFRHAFSEAAHRNTFIHGWRTYHLRLVSCVALAHTAIWT